MVSAVDFSAYPEDEGGCMRLDGIWKQDLGIACRSILIIIPVRPVAQRNLPLVTEGPIVFGAGQECGAWEIRWRKERGAHLMGTYAIFHSPQVARLPPPTAYPLISQTKLHAPPRFCRWGWAISFSRIKVPTLGVYRGGLYSFR